MIEFCEILRVQRQRGRQILAEDLPRGFRVRPLDLDLHVQPTWPQDRRVDHVLSVRGSDDDHIVQALDTVDLAQQLRHDGVLHV